jgi:signal transduction histidine kinase
MKAADDLRRLVRGALAEMRAMLLELRPTALLATSLDDLVRQLAEAITGRTLLSVSLNLEPVPPLPPDVHLTFYRVCQEALQNAVKHADASHVTVSLRTSALGSPNGNGPRGELALERSDAQSESTWRGQVLLQVSDDGQGFDPQNTRPDQLGLRIMREHAESIGARLSLECRPGVGTQVALAWQSG